jgi:hypothetical protein
MDREDTPTETASEVLAHVADLFPSAVVTVTAAHLDQLDGRKPEVVTLTNGGRR